ncbi:MAG: hypothetical protein ACH37Z_13675 [Anaerolineae bacterium]
MQAPGARAVKAGAPVLRLKGMRSWPAGRGRGWGPWVSWVLFVLCVLFAPAHAPPHGPLHPRHAQAQAPAAPPRPLYLPFLDRAQPPELRYPDPAMAEALWEAAIALDGRYLGPRVFPGEAAAGGLPTDADVQLNLTAACHDFPDEPGGLFGKGAHRDACAAWVASWRGLWHATRAWRAAHPADGRAVDVALADPRDIAWAQRYLARQSDAVAHFVYGPGDVSDPSYRDTLAALWQNPARAGDLILLAELLRQLDALPAEQAARVTELAGGIARAWQATYRVGDPTVIPNTDRPFSTLAFPAVEAISPDGRQVAPAFSWTFGWHADKGNTQAEENGWQGAGMLLTGRALGRRLADAPALAAGATRYLDFALVYDRLDEGSGQRVRSLNAETAGGPYGQRRYWLENHTADVPSIPYLGFTWQTLGMALMTRATEAGPWPSLVPDAAAWEVMRQSVLATVRAPDDGLLIDFRPGRGIGYAMDPYPLWAMPCGQWQAGRHYVRYDGRAGPGPAYLSEIGHPAGIDVINLSPPVLRLAAWRGDADSYLVWRRRLAATVEEYRLRPPNPAWAACNIAPYVSANPGYHGARLQSAFLVAYLQLRGFTVGVWEAVGAAANR